VRVLGRPGVGSLVEPSGKQGRARCPVAAPTLGSCPQRGESVALGFALFKTKRFVSLAEPFFDAKSRRAAESRLDGDSALLLKAGDYSPRFLLPWVAYTAKCAASAPRRMKRELDNVKSIYVDLFHE